MASASTDGKTPVLEEVSSPSSPYSAVDTWKDRIIIPTVLAGIAGGGVGLVSKQRIIHGVSAIASAYAANFAIVTGCYCGHKKQGWVALNTNTLCSSIASEIRDNLKPCPTPMVTGKLLLQKQGEPMENPSLYKSAIGGLQYLTLTRPDIAFAVNTLSQFMQDPYTEHWLALKRLFRYVAGTIELGLLFRPSDVLDLTGFSDANWAICPIDRKSTGGYCVNLGQCLVSWSSKKQDVVSRSSCEAEYRALANLATVVKWIKQILDEMQFKLPTVPRLWCDNTDANSLAQNPVYHARTKHIEVDVHYIRNQVLNKEVEVNHISTADQIADVFTKALSTTAFNRCT